MSEITLHFLGEMGECILKKMKPKFIYSLQIVLSLVVLFTAGCFSETELERQERIHNAIQTDIAKAGELAKKNDYTAALKLLERGNEKYPNQPEFFEAIANLYDQIGDSALCGFYFEQAYMLDEEHLDFSLLAANAYMKAENWDSAIKNYLRYLELMPRSDAVLKSLSQAYLKSNKFTLALDAAVRAVEVSKQVPSLDEALFIGNLALKVKDYDKAQFWYNQALNKKNNDVRALFGLVQISLIKKSYEGLEKSLKSLDAQKTPLSDSPEVAQARQVLAKIKADEQRAAEKRRLAELEKLALEEAKRKRLFEEEQAAKEALLAKVDEDKSIVAAAANECGQVSNAQDALSPQAQFIEAAEKFKNAGDYQSAIKQYWKALAVDDNNANTWNSLAEAFRLEGDYNQAEMAVLEAIRRGGENLVYRLHYLEIIQVGRSAQFYMQEVQELRKKFPNSPEIMLLLAAAYRDVAKNNRNALMIYEQYLEQYPEGAERESVEDCVAKLRQENGVVR